MAQQNGQVATSGRHNPVCARFWLEKRHIMPTDHRFQFYQASLWENSDRNFQFYLGNRAQSTFRIISSTWHIIWINLWVTYSWPHREGMIATSRALVSSSVLFDTRFYYGVQPGLELTTFLPLLFYYWYDRHYYTRLIICSIFPSTALYLTPSEPQTLPHNECSKQPIFSSFYYSNPDCSLWRKRDHKCTSHQSQNAPNI